MEIIKSKDNLTIKKAVSLMENKRERIKHGQFVIEGLRICKDAALNGANIQTVLMTEEFKSKHSDDASVILNACDNFKIISPEISKKLGDTVTSQGVYCICNIPSKSVEINGDKYIVLENVQDPGNIGTIIRTAEAFGIDGVILVGNCADVYSPKVLRSTMGTVFTMPLFFYSDIEEAVNNLKKVQITVCGAVLNDRAQLLSKKKSEPKIAYLIGNEGNGLSDNAISLCDEFVYIDMNGKAESLNAAVAASVIMWEMSK